MPQHLVTRTLQILILMKADGEGNYSAFMAIAHVKSSEDLNLLVQELKEHSDEESIGIV